MIPAGVEIFVAVAPIDLRWGFDRLAGLANEQLGRSARSGALLVFFGKRKSAVKVLFFDGSYRSGKVVSLRGRALGGSVGVELVPRRAVVEWLT